MASGDELDQILTLEHSGWQSLCDSTGADFYGRLMIDDGVMVLAHGFALDREQVIASLDDAPSWDEYTISDERLIRVGEDVVALVYTGRARRGTEPEFAALMSSTYVRDGARWKLALYQQTPISA